MTPNSQCQVIFQRPYVRVFLLNDLACFSFRSAAAAILVREPLQKASKPYKGSSQADIDAGQVESRSKNWQALLCTARAASAVHEWAMAGQGRSPCGLGGSKGGHSSAKNGPFCWPPEGVSPFDLLCRPRHSPVKQVRIPQKPPPPSRNGSDSARCRSRAHGTRARFCPTPPRGRRAAAIARAA